jgi:hypothetical protein
MKGGVLMPSTVVTKEPLADNVSEEDVKREIRLRLKAGCVRSWVQTEAGRRILCTEWNVIGDNDDSG